MSLRTCLCFLCFVVSRSNHLVTGQRLSANDRNGRVLSYSITSFNLRSSILIIDSFSHFPKRLHSMYVSEISFFVIVKWTCIFRARVMFFLLLNWLKIYCADFSQDNKFVPPGLVWQLGGKVKFIISGNLQLEKTF